MRETRKSGTSKITSKPENTITRIKATKGTAINEKQTTEENESGQYNIIQSIIDNFDTTFFSVDRDYNLTGFNKSQAAVMKSLYGVDIHKGDSFLDKITVTDNRRKAKNTIDRVFSTGEVIVDEDYIGEKSLSRRYFEISHSPLKNEAKEVTGVIITGKDITQHKLAEDALRESEERFRKIFEEAPIGMVLVGSNHKFLNANPTFCRMLGYTEEELRQKTFVDVTHPEHRDIDRMNVEKMWRGEISRYITEKRYIAKNGQIYWGSLSSSIIRNQDGKPISLLAMIEDITERNKSEILIKQQREEYKTLIDTVPAVIVYVDKNGRILRINRAGAGDLGLEPEEVVGKTYHDLFPAHIADRYVAQVRQVMDTGVPIMGTITHLSFSSGKEIDAEADMLPYLDHKGKIIGAISMVQDITIKKKALKDLEQRNIQLAKTLNDAINAMVRIVELRDPYTAGHQQGVAKLATAIAVEIGMDEERVHSINMASLVHDIGKIYIPSDILSKPGTLSAAEFELIKTHPAGGHDIVASIDFPFPVALAVLQHHERLDGSGYPNNLKDEEILPESRIIAVADVVEAMSSYRPYRPAVGIEMAFNEIIQNRGIKYDAQIVDTCIKLFKEKGFSFNRL